MAWGMLKLEKKEVHLVILFSIFLLFATLYHKPWIIGDGQHQYAYVRSFVIDGDIDFSNEYSYYRTLNYGGALDPSIKTVTGLPHNLWPVGSAILWSPFFLAAHWIELSQGHMADGYSQIYLSFTTIGTMIYGLIGIFLMYLLICEFAPPEVSLISTICVWLGSSVVFYIYHDPSVSQAHSFFAATLFLYYWYKSRNSSSPSRYALLGILGGLMALVKWQDSLYLIVLIYDMIKSLRTWDKAVIIEQAKNILLMSIFLLIAFLPQMLAWKALYGKFLTVPEQPEFFLWYPRYIFDYLFSLRRGLFIWTPVALLSILGMRLFIKERRWIAIVMLLAMASQLYFNSSIVDWVGGWSFGARRMSGSTAIFGIGAAYFLMGIKNRKMKIASIILMVLCSIWTVSLLSQAHFDHSIISLDYPLERLFQEQLRFPELLYEIIRSKIGN
jgi:hypothetical protein